MRPRSLLESYLERSGRSLGELPAALVAYLANLQLVDEACRPVAESIVRELADQRRSLKLIASENYSSPAVQAAMANLLTDKYAEGVPGRRFYAGCDNVDAVESFARDRACELFGCDHAYVQPHSGADANLVAFWAILSTRVEKPALEGLNAKDAQALPRRDWEALREQLGRQRLLGMDLNSGGHLTHGYRLNVSARMFEAHGYAVDRSTGLLDYEQIDRQAQELRPLILLAGYSAYPRAINFARMREIADRCGAVLMVDMAHFAGLVAGKQFTGDFDPVPHAHVVTSTTHKTLRGPRGGIVLCTREFAEAVDKGCPLVLGGPLPHVIAAKAICLVEALRPEFRDYARRVVENAAALAQAFQRAGERVVTGGTDNHLVLLDVTQHGITGRQAEAALRECGVTLNRNAVPFDPNGPWYASGLRLGTPAMSTLGMGTGEMEEVASIIVSVLRQIRVDESTETSRKAKYHLAAEVRTAARARVASLLGKFPVYPEIAFDELQALRGARSPGADGGTARPLVADASVHPS